MVVRVLGKIPFTGYVKFRSIINKSHLGQCERDLNEWIFRVGFVMDFVLAYFVIWVEVLKSSVCYYSIWKDSKIPRRTQGKLTNWIHDAYV